MNAFLSLLLAAAVTAPLPPNGWQATLDAVTPAIVVLRINPTRAFDGGSTGDRPD